MRNNEYAASLHNSFQTNLGTSTMRSKAPDAKEYNDAKERLWLRYTENCEVSGLSLAEVESIIYTELLCAGEVFALKLKDGRFQLIPSEYVFSAPDADENECQGIIYNGPAPIAYRIGSRDKNGQLVPGASPVPAALVMHIYRRERVEQRRGVPWLSAAVNSLKDIDELTTAKVQSVKNQSFLSFAVTSDSGSGVLPNLAETGNTNGATKATGRPSKRIKLETGTVVYMERGDEIRALSTQFQSQDFEAFLLSRLRAVGATIGLPLELFLEGYKDSSYSSARATNMAWGRKVRTIRELLSRLFLHPLQLWFSGRQRAAGALKGTPALDRECDFSWPPVPHIDELKETEANIAKLAAGLTTYSAVYAENNLFFEDEVKVRARDARLLIEAAKAEGVPVSMLLPDLTPAPAPAAPPAPAESTPVDKQATNIDTP
jgi:capsid protein